MAQEICGKTKVVYKGKEYICDKFTDIWKVLTENNYGIDEDNKGYLLRLLFIQGFANVDDNLSMEIVWED